MNGSLACHKSCAVRGSFREFWHVAASAWQNSHAASTHPASCSLVGGCQEELVITAHEGHGHGGEEGERKPAVAAFDGEQLTGGVAEPMKCDGGGAWRPVRA
jgi:hypothetical protein